MKTLLNESLPVDAGNISIVHESVVKKYGQRTDLKSCYRVIEVKEGASITIQVYNTWLDDVSHVLKNVQGGKYFVGDAGYFISEWMDFLNSTEYMERMPNGSASLNTGGDGCFEVIVEA